MSRDKAQTKLFAVINGCLIESLGESTTPTYTRIHYLLKELESFDGIDVDAIGFNQLPGKGWRRILYNNAVKTAVALRSAWRLIVNRPMVFFAYPHSLTTIQNRALFRLCELLKLKTILDIHDTIEQASAIGIEKFALNEHLEEHYFRNASLILALNMPMWKHIESEYKLPQNKQVAFIPNAYEREFCRYYPDAYKSVENRFNICYIGGITKNRGIEILVEACEKLHHRYPNLKLYLYGSYSARFPSDLRERMESSDFIIRRVVLRRDIHESLLFMDLLVMPYNPKDNYMNLSSPTKFFEYIGTGIPILCTRCESLLEIGKQGGIIYFDYSAADLESKIEMLIDNPSMREELSEKIMEIRADHTWDRRAKVLYESIKSL